MAFVYTFRSFIRTQLNRHSNYDMDNDDQSVQSVLFGEIPLNGTDTRSYSIKKPPSNGSATTTTSDVEYKNHINSKSANSLDGSSAVINIDMDGKL